jgi:hypothetical protein
MELRAKTPFIPFQRSRYTSATQSQFADACPIRTNPSAIVPVSKIQTQAQLQEKILLLPQSKMLNVKIAGLHWLSIGSVVGE